MTDTNSTLSTIDEPQDAVDLVDLSQIDVNRRDAIVARAKTAVNGLVSNPDDRDAVNRVCRVGMEAERKTEVSYTLLQQRVRTSLRELRTDSGPGADVIRSMAELRALTAPMNEIAQEPTWFIRLFDWFPGSNLLVTRLRRICVYYETHDEQIRGLIASARSGQTQLASLNDENQRLYASVKVDVENLTATLVLIKAVIDELKARIDATPKGARRDQLEGFLLIVTKRAEAIAQTINMMEMDLVAIRTRITDNEIWYQKIGNQLMTAPHLLETALLIHLNIVQSNRIADSVEGWDRLIDQLMTSNATATRQAHRRALESYSKGVVGMQAMAKAQQEFTAMFAEEEGLRQKLLTAAEENIRQAEAGAAQLRERRTGREAADSLPSGQQFKSLEVSDL